MWPFDAGAPPDVVRAGRSTVEHWRAVGMNLELHGRHALPVRNPPAPDDFAAAIGALFAQPPARKLALVMESAWMPLLLLDNGTRILSRTEIDALARHRFRRHHDSSIDPVAAWSLRIDYRAGERWSLAYGLPSRVLAAATAAAKVCGVTWSSVSPALDRRVLDPGRRWRPGGAWRVLVEEDRCIVLHMKGGRATGLHAAMPPGCGLDHVLASVRAEEARLGLAAGLDRIRVFHWAQTDIGGPDARVSWSDLASANPSAPPAHPLGAYARTSG